jgi:hypothetical protein
MRRIAGYIQEQLLIDRIAELNTKICGEFARNGSGPSV